MRHGPSLRLNIFYNDNPEARAFTLDVARDPFARLLSAVKRGANKDMPETSKSSTDCSLLGDGSWIGH